MNLFEHEMLVAAFAGLLGVPLDGVDVLLDDIAVGVSDGPSGTVEASELAVSEVTIVGEIPEAGTSLARSSRRRRCLTRAASRFARQIPSHSRQRQRRRHSFPQSVDRLSDSVFGVSSRL